MGVRTLCISDIHVDINRSYPVMEALAEYARQQGAGCILIAGDICENVYQVKEYVQELKEKSRAAVYYVPGNHDLWHKGENKLSTDDIYELFCMDEACLCGKQVCVGEHIVLGDVGWYDYSFGSPEYTGEQYDLMEHEGRVWQDRHYNDWTQDNSGRNSWFLNRLEKQLVKASDAGKSIVAVTHMLPHRGFTVPTDDRPMWKFFNAFLGSCALGQLYQHFPVDYALCGHVHYRYDFTENGICYMCRCLNYASEWIGDKDVRKQIAGAAKIVEL